MSTKRLSGTFSIGDQNYSVSLAMLTEWFYAEPIRHTEARLTFKPGSVQLVGFVMPNVSDIEYIGAMVSVSIFSPLVELGPILYMDGIIDDPSRIRSNGAIRMANGDPVDSEILCRYFGVTKTPRPEPHPTGPEDFIATKR